MDRMSTRRDTRAQRPPTHADQAPTTVPNCQRLDVDDAHERSALFWPLVPSRCSLSHSPTFLWLSTECLSFFSSPFGSLNLHSLISIHFSSSLACSRFSLRVPTTAVPPCLQTAAAAPDIGRHRGSTSLTYTDPSYPERAVYLVLIRTQTSRHDANHNEFHWEL